MLKISYIKGSLIKQGRKEEGDLKTYLINQALH